MTHANNPVPTRRQRVADYTQSEMEAFYRDGKPGVPLYSAHGGFRAYVPWKRADAAYYEQRRMGPR